MSPIFAVALFMLGGFTGFTAGLLGIGGGLILVPFLTFLFAHQGFAAQHVVHMAVATSLATILFTSLSSVRAHHRHGGIRWVEARSIALGILVGGWAGALVAARLPTFWLALIFAGFVGFAATRMISSRQPRPGRALPGAAGLFGIGTLIGAISSFVGAGGGFISVPFMVWCNVPMHQAVATSAALGFPVAAAGTIGYVISGWNVPGLPPATLGFVYLPALLVVAAASVLTAPLGARLAHRLGTRTLKRVFAGLLYSLAIYMGWHAFH